MKVLLSTQCISFTGMLQRGLGYHLVKRKNGFFARRDSKGLVPPDGHWRFIVLCAELAQNGLYITDVRVSGGEIAGALLEAGLRSCAALAISKNTYNAKDVLAFKERVGL
jgi:hypothetical protein